MIPLCFLLFVLLVKLLWLEIPSIAARGMEKAECKARRPEGERFEKFVTKTDTGTGTGTGSLSCYITKSASD